MGPFQLSLSAIVGIAVVSSLVIIVLGIFIVMIVYKQKIKLKEREVINNVMMNPDYITQEDFYQTDDWELAR